MKWVENEVQKNMKNMNLSPHKSLSQANSKMIPQNQPISNNMMANSNEPLREKIKVNLSKSNIESEIMQLLSTKNNIELNNLLSNHEKQKELLAQVPSINVNNNVAMDYIEKVKGLASKNINMKKQIESLVNEITEKESKMKKFDVDASSTDNKSMGITYLRELVDESDINSMQIIKKNLKESKNVNQFIKEFIPLRISYQKYSVMLDQIANSD